MNQNKKGDGWLLCSSKSFPGKYYYFNVFNGVTAWTADTEVDKSKKLINYSTIHSNYPEPKTRPPEDTPSNTKTHCQPKAPSITPSKPKPPVTRFTSVPATLPRKDIPNFVWAPIPISYLDDNNTQNFDVEKPNMSSVELVNDKHQSREDNNSIVVQVHTCKNQYVSKRFVSCNKNLNSDETNQRKIKNPFSFSTPNQPFVQKSYFSFDKKNHQFHNDTPNKFQLTKNTYNNKNKYIKNPSFVFQSTTSEHEAKFNLKLPTNEANTFRDVIKNNGFVTPKTTFDTPNETYRNTPNRFGIPKETPAFDTPGFGFHTPNETYTPKDTIGTDTPQNSYGFDIPEKDIYGFSTPKTITFGIDTPDKTIHGFGTPQKITFDINTPDKTIHGFGTPKNITFGIDTPDKTIHGFSTPKKITFGIDTPKTTEIQTKIPEESNLPDSDLRNVLLRKRKIENSMNNDENAKKIKAFYERQATPKKHVTFKLDTISDIDSSEDFSYTEHVEALTPPCLAVETISSLRRLGATDDPWYIAIDLNVLLENFDYIDAFIKTDPLCRLLVPYSVYKELITTSTACDSRARVISARNILRRLDCSNNRYRVQDAVIGSEKLKSPKDQIQCCCIELIRNNIHVVLITNNDILYKEAKEKRIHVIKMSQIQDGGPETPDVTFDIRKIKFQIPNDNCVLNSKGKDVEVSVNQTVIKRNYMNTTNENHEQKSDEKYKSSVENFWRSDNSDDSFDFVSRKIQNLDVVDRPVFLENEPKNQLTSKKLFQKETVTSNYLKPMTNVIITKNVIQNGSASEESLFDSKSFGTFATYRIENQDKDNQYSIFEKSASGGIQDNRNPDLIEENEHSIVDNPASKESNYYKNGINRNFIFKDLTEDHNQHSILQKSSSKESENHVNDNQYLIFSKPASKKEEQSIFKQSANHGNDNQNSIFEIDSNFMPLTSKTIEDYLKRFNIKNKMMEDCLKNNGNEKICCLRQILEDFGNVLQESSSNSRACVVYNIFQKILKIYGKHQLIRDVIEKLKILLYKSEERMRVDLLPFEIMQAIGCGILLVQLLQELKPSEYLTDIEKGLNELIQSIENPTKFECLETPIILKGEKNCIYGENRNNFTKEESEIIQYLKKHYPAWTHFDETVTSVKEKPEIKIYRTIGKNLNLFKLNRSRIIVEKAIENDVPSNSEPNSIRFHENDRAKTQKIENNNPTVFTNEEKDKYKNSRDKKEKKTEISLFFENFDIQNELKSLKTTENVKPKVIRPFSNDKGEEKTNFNSKMINFDSKTINFDSKTTNVDTKTKKVTDFHLNHENTFGPTQSGRKVVRNIAPIPKYEDIFKLSVQNGPTTKPNQNGLQDTITLSDTEDVSNEDFLIQNPKIDSKYENNYNKIQNVDNFVTSSLDGSIKCYSVSDGASNNMIDNGIENKTLELAISTFFKEIKNCFQNIQNFIISSMNKIKKTENNTEIKSIENTAKKIHNHIIRIIEKLSVYREAKGENKNFTIFNSLDNEGNSTELYITKCRQLSSLCIEQAQMLEKMVIELCNLIN